MGGVIVTTCSDENEHIKRLKTYGIPYIYLNRTYEDDLDHCLRIKNRKAADEAVSYLIDMGHKNIGGLFRSFDNMIYRERYEGMLDSLERHGLRIDKEKILFNVKDSEDSYQII